ncbi:hypothetical protein ABFX02_06G084500 [Erythranthe guttata]
MENHPPNHTKVLSIDLTCCGKCPNILENILLRMPGVDSVSIDTEKGLVFVTGKIDPTTLLDKVSNLGKEVRLLPNNKDTEEKIHEHTTRQGRDKKYSAPREKGQKSHKNCCCQDGRHYQKKEEKKEEEEAHKCEAYVAPNIDPRVCRDFYCKIHPKMRKIIDRVPADSSSWFGGLPFHSGYGPYGAESYIYPGWYGEEPPRYGYPRPHPPPSMLQHPFGFH